MTPKEFNITEYSKAFISKIKHYENKNVLFIGFDDIDVISEIINQKYKNCNIYIVDNKETCDCIPLLNLNANIYVLNSYNEENNYIKEVFGPLNFYDDILISVWKNGASITTSALKLLKENGICVCSMLLSNYKKNELYRHVETFELANPKLFKDADITENLSICLLRKENVDKYSWMDLTLAAVDTRYIEYYKWNVENNKNIKMRQIRDKEVLPENIDKHHDDWFIETIRCSAHGSHQGGFGKGGTWYKWNMENQTGISNAFAGVIDNLGRGLNNFRKWWYYLPVQCGLASRVIGGINKDNFVGTGYFAIPQIDWENIHINQKELWDKGLYDEAVLAEMHLKWNNDKTKIVQA